MIKVKNNTNYESKIFDSLHQSRWINHTIKNEVYCLDNQVVNHLLNEEEILYDDIINLYNTYDDNTETQEISQYFRVSEWLAKRLSELDQPIILSDEFNSSWWGRTTFGQSLEMDYIWKELYYSIFSDKDIENHNKEEQANITKDKKLLQNLEQIQEYMISDLYYVELDEDPYGEYTEEDSTAEHDELCDAIEKAINIIRGLK